MPRRCRITATPVVVASAVSKNVPVYIDEIGKTVARRGCATRFQPLLAAIMQIHFQDGAQLKKGDLLFTIDPRPYEAALKQAEATLAQNEADVKWNTSDLKRVEGLAGTGAVSQQDLESKQNALAVSQAKVQSAEAAILTAKLNLAIIARSNHRSKGESDCDWSTWEMVVQSPADRWRQWLLAICYAASSLTLRRDFYYPRAKSSAHSPADGQRRAEDARLAAG